MRHLKLAVYLFGCLLSHAATAQFWAYYSLADSTVFIQYPSATSWEDDYITFRLRYNGMVLERLPLDIPGMIVISDRTPGRVFSRKLMNDGTTVQYQSQDLGETWQPMSSFPFPMYEDHLRGRDGDQPGESWLLDDYFGYCYYTSDGWESYDSVLTDLSDSIWTHGFFYGNGRLLGATYHHRIAMSSDTGRTWHLASPDNPDTIRIGSPGIPDELWYFDMPTATEFHVYTVQDTGRIRREVFDGSLSERSLPWKLLLIPTDHAGEIYFIVAWENWVVLEFYVYHIKDYGADIGSSYFFEYVANSVEPSEPSIPHSLSVACYPNPFNSITEIRFDLPERADVELKVFNLLGQDVATIAKGDYNSGSHTVQFDASSLPSGVYIYSLQTNNLHINRKMILLK